MPQPANTYDSYTAGNTNREDVQDIIYMVTPEKTPVLSSGRRFKAEQRAHEWERDALAAPTATNAVIEGDDRSGTPITPPQRIGNFTQLMDKVATVTSSQEKSNAIGMTSSMKRAVAKQKIELKRDLEARMVSSLPAVAGSSTVARQTAGLGCMIFTNASHGGAGATPAHNSGFPTTAVTAGTNRAFTQALLDANMQAIFTQSGEMPSMAVMSPNHKTIFSTFAGIAQNRRDIKGKEQATIIGGADVYVSNFGNLTVVPHYMMAGGSEVYLLNGDNYGVAYLQGFSDTPLAKTGHTDRRMVFVEAAVVVTAERALGKIANLTP
jgi:hypothetical protein